MTHYYVSNSKGTFEKSDFDGSNDEKSEEVGDQPPFRDMSQPQRKSTR